MKYILSFAFGILLCGAVYLVVPKQYDFDGTLEGIPPTGKYRCEGFTFIGSANLKCIDCGFAMYCQGLIMKAKAAPDDGAIDAVETQS
jgi:hypothetical protein